MAWTAPTTRATGDLITASNWNTDLVNNLLYAPTAFLTPPYGSSGSSTNIGANAAYFGRVVVPAAPHS